MTEIENLRAELVAGEVRLIPFADCHLEPLRAACAVDSAIWDIYPVAMFAEHFDQVMAQRMSGTEWVNYAVCMIQEVVGITQAAVLKLGAMREGLLRGDLVTWTGHRRNTCVFSLLHGEWQG